MLESYFTRAPEISAKMQQKKQKQALADMHKAHTHTVEKNSEFSEAASSLAMFFKWFANNRKGHFYTHRVRIYTLLDVIPYVMFSKWDTHTHTHSHFLGIEAIGSKNTRWVGL
jgi:hypothetical protein